MQGKSDRGEIVLLPNTIDYYQNELTKLLELEAYGDAVQLLEFLVACSTEDARTNEHWLMLMQWLKLEFPEAASRGNAADTMSDDKDEEELLVQNHVTSRLSQDKDYVQRMLSDLEHGGFEQQLLALDQLSYMQDSRIPELLLRLLRNRSLHPTVSFRMLQTLKKQGVQDRIVFHKLGEIVAVDIEITPLYIDQFPNPLLDIYERVRACAEWDDPTLSLFAKQTWGEFLIHCYGTPQYGDLLNLSDQERGIWAAALHVCVAEVIHGSDIKTVKILQQQYGIDQTMMASWEKAVKHIKAYFVQARGANA
jgi:hypothetical protein